MNIRGTLAILLSIFGIMLLAALVYQGSVAYRNYQASFEQIVIDQTRNDLLSSIIRLQEGGAQIAWAKNTAVFGQTYGKSLDHAVDSIRRASDALSGVDNIKLQELSEDIGREISPLALLSDELTAVFASGRPDAIQAQSDNALDQIETVSQRLMSLRQAILVEVGITNTTIAGVHMLRNYIVAINGALQKDRMLTLLDLQGGTLLTPQQIRQIEFRAGTLQAADQVYQEIVGVYNENIVDLVNSLSEYLRLTYLPARAAVTQAESARENVEIARTTWIDSFDEAAILISGIQASVFEISQANLAQQRNNDLIILQQSAAVSVSIILFFVLSLYIIEKLIVSPLERIRLRMDDIVNAKFDPITRDRFWLQDTRSIADALRVFRVTAMRRERMTHSQLMMHSLIAESHSNLQSDMQAAAEVQRAQMPAPGNVNQIHFATFFAPSDLLAGDTFDYFALSEDRVGLFQADVAGHGAAAGLVSVAAHLGARRALHGVKPGVSLADSIRTLNAFWNPKMTYFTLGAFLFDIKKDRGSMVQAGHPYPVLMRQDGSVIRLGNGGLPIGVVPDAEFEEVEFPFAFGDRLILFSDGVYENANSENEIYTEERFIQLLSENAGCSSEDLVDKVRQAIGAWSGVDKLSDDISLVIAERF